MARKDTPKTRLNPLGRWRKEADGKRTDQQAVSKSTIDNKLRAAENERSEGLPMARSERLAVLWTREL